MGAYSARLRECLAWYGLADQVDPAWRLDGSDGRAAQRAILRWLNQLESTLDELLARRSGASFAAWDQLRHELGLLPRAHEAWSLRPEQLDGQLALLDLDDAQRGRARRLWLDFLFLAGDRLSPLQSPAGWVAALEYLLQSLYFKGSRTQAEIGRRHSVSTSTVGLRYRALVETLGVELFDHPARKRLIARRTVAVGGGRMSDSEFNRRLVRGERVVEP